MFTKAFPSCSPCQLGQEEIWLFLPPKHPTLFPMAIALFYLRKINQNHPAVQVLCIQILDESYKLYSAKRKKRSHLLGILKNMSLQWHFHEPTACHKATIKKETNKGKRKAKGSQKGSSPSGTSQLSSSSSSFLFLEPSCLLSCVENLDWGRLVTKSNRQAVNNHCQWRSNKRIS